ncbi:hypothetical protein Q9295_11895 [Xinfangfangia sp. CPCC 101601]|uniref:Uncharacterized protein n=1 Tax=Pseudogemmobacter lacusdianii TaxID=3069608 RepID=A0ABU0VZA4_9RHOB|nr:hypothetical protein [Xinfangfangia sp. CPCC 101601]MDQ2067081.1 hypothetical protein [Xinfangfangia sp. CPCC 101601]
MTSLHIESEAVIGAVTYPAAPPDVTGSIPEVIWSILENYVATRWSTAEVEFVVHSPCRNGWRPPYYPWVVQSVDGDPAEVNEFGEVTLEPGRHKVVCQIGGQVVTAGVQEAYRRLSAYYSDPDNQKGYSRYSVNLGGEISESWSRGRNTSAVGNSGAAELLRKYRKAGIAHV